MKSLMYSKENCPYCDAARTLLDSLSIDYIELKLGVDYAKEDLVQVMEANNRPTDRLTVPQVFLNGRYIGGSDDLAKYVEETGIMGIRE